MTIPSKAVGAVSLFSCVRDIHKTSMIRAKQLRQKEMSDAYIATSVGCQKTNRMSYRDTERKNWFAQNNFFLGATEVLASVKGYLKGVKEGITEYAPNIVLAALSIIPDKNPQSSSQTP